MLLLLSNLVLCQNILLMIWQSSYCLLLSKMFIRCSKCNLIHILLCRTRPSLLEDVKFINIASLMDILICNKSFLTNPYLVAKLVEVKVHVHNIVPIIRTSFSLHACIHKSIFMYVSFLHYYR